MGITTNLDNLTVILNAFSTGLRTASVCDVTTKAAQPINTVYDVNT